MKLLILAPILTTTLFFFVHFNLGSSRSHSERPTSQELTMNDAPNLNYPALIGLTGFLSFISLVAFYRSKKIEPNENCEPEEDSYFG
ncbi:MAG: hypothetical protein MUD14_27410 [Hydrococcus sp. Prado102]|jgi:hypothetical protein|nr:hypothetical protein [Hydrococcus sp. Prado102]